MFRDDIRNGISHADYVLWDDGLRLRNRNGGYAKTLTFFDVSEALTRAVGFFEILEEYNGLSVRSFNPAKEIVGRFSANFPMPWTVSWNSETGTFSISGSSPGPVITPVYQRQTEVNDLLGGKVLATYRKKIDPSTYEVDQYIRSLGFEPNDVVLENDRFDLLVAQVNRGKLWDDCGLLHDRGKVLIASPWGFQWLDSSLDFDKVLPEPLVDFQVV